MNYWFYRHFLNHIFLIILHVSQLQIQCTVWYSSSNCVLNCKSVIDALCLPGEALKAKWDYGTAVLDQFNGHNWYWYLLLLDLVTTSLSFIWFKTDWLKKVYYDSFFNVYISFEFGTFCVLERNSSLYNKLLFHVFALCYFPTVSYCLLWKSNLNHLILN